MSRPRLALLLLVLSVLFPVRGLAQTPPPLVPAPPTAEPYEPGVEDPESEEAPRDELIPREWPPSERLTLKVPRIMLEVLGGAAVGLAAGIPGAGLALNQGFNEGSGSVGGFYAGVLLSFAGLTLGSALGIKGLGSLLDGEGRYLTTLAGAALGGLGGAGLGMVIGWGAGSELWFIPTLLGPIVGGIIAYEISHANFLRERAEPAPSGTAVLPVISVSPGGGIIGGLAGRF